ncbi:MAG: hypothetical protein ABEJ43_07620 [Haloferacaceae archaeon]
MRASVVTGEGTGANELGVAAAVTSGTLPERNATSRRREKGQVVTRGLAETRPAPVDIFGRWDGVYTAGR